jgi:hypothetical protein
MKRGCFLRLILKQEKGRNFFLIHRPIDDKLVPTIFIKIDTFFFFR